MSIFTRKGSHQTTITNPIISIKSIIIIIIIHWIMLTSSPNTGTCGIILHVYSVLLLVHLRNKCSQLWLQTLWLLNKHGFLPWAHRLCQAFQSDRRSSTWNHNLPFLQAARMHRPFVKDSFKKIMYILAE